MALFTEGEYLDLTFADARTQMRSLKDRAYPSSGNQVTFIPVETLLCVASSLVIDYWRFGSNTAPKAPSPVPELAALFKRPNSSVIAKMNNIDGRRSRGAKLDLVVGTILRSDTERLSRIYQTIFAVARMEGITPEVLPDFLGVEHGGTFRLLGQQEIDSDVVDSVLEEKLAKLIVDQPALTPKETESLLLTKTRIGQHRFASNVLTNCGHACVFCGLTASKADSPRMLIASHIKPWRSSDDAQRLDMYNGVAACPTHDVAFDSGLLAISSNRKIEVSPRLRSQMESNPATMRYFEQPPMYQQLRLDGPDFEKRLNYLRWHRENLFQSAAAGRELA